MTHTKNNWKTIIIFKVNNDKANYGLLSYLSKCLSHSLDVRIKTCLLRLNAVCKAFFNTSSTCESSSSNRSISGPDPSKEGADRIVKMHSPFELYLELNS